MSARWHQRRQGGQFEFEWNGWVIQRDPEHPTMWRTRKGAATRLHHTLQEARRWAESREASP